MEDYEEFEKRKRHYLEEVSRVAKESFPGAKEIRTEPSDYDRSIDIIFIYGADRFFAQSVPNAMKMPLDDLLSEIVKISLYLKAYAQGKC